MATCFKMALFSSDLFSVFDDDSDSSRRSRVKRPSSKGTSFNEKSTSDTKRQKLDLESLEVDDGDDNKAEKSPEMSQQQDERYYNTSK